MLLSCCICGALATSSRQEPTSSQQLPVVLELPNRSRRRKLIREKESDFQPLCVQLV